MEIGVSKFIPCLIASLLGFTSCTHIGRESADKPYFDLLHADLPIYGNGTEELWPQSYDDPDPNIIGGCTSRVASGDWRYLKLDDEANSDGKWYRVTMPGLFHCSAHIGEAYERQDLEGAEVKPSFFAFLETVNISGLETELWVMQIGVRPGSKYLLLSRAPEAELIKSFNVLQIQCPRTNIRSSGIIDTLRTDYCAINSKIEMLRFAKRMAIRSPARTLTLVGELNTE